MTHKSPANIKFNLVTLGQGKIMRHHGPHDQRNDGGREGRNRHDGRPRATDEECLKSLRSTRRMPQHPGCTLYHGRLHSIEAFCVPSMVGSRQHWAQNSMGRERVQGGKEARQPPMKIQYTAFASLLNVWRAVSACRSRASRAADSCAFSVLLPYKLVKVTS